MNTVDQARLLSNALLQLVREEGMVFLAQRVTVDASVDTDTFGSAEAALVGLRILSVGTHLRDGGDASRVARDRDRVTDHLDLDAACFRGTQVTSGVLCGP